MKFETTPAFDADYRRLKREHREAFRRVLKTKFIPACDALAVNPSAAWPKSLRVKSVQGVPGVLEMTWSFASPDGRATFELVTVGEELRCRWRRIGDHSVFYSP
ncbi:MAG: hypothetical protein ACRDTN_07925 [Mycobacterium sp.]